jgi:hypothetical protein
LAYRKVEDGVKQKLYPKIHFLHKNVPIAKIFMLLGIGLVFMSLLQTYIPG